MADLRSETLRRWQERASRLNPPPTSMAVHGSWARGEARSDSDIDIMIVLPSGLDDTAEDAYREQVADWCAYASRVAGLPVSPLVIDAHDSGWVSGELWNNIRRDAELIAGGDPRTVLGAA